MRISTWTRESLDTKEPVFHVELTGEDANGIIVKIGELLHNSLVECVKCKESAFFSYKEIKELAEGLEGYEKTHEEWKEVVNNG